MKQLLYTTLLVLTAHVLTLSAQVQLNSGPSTPIPNMSGMVTGDFNHDGKLDVAVVSGTGGLYFNVELGQGNGFFLPGYQQKVSIGENTTLISEDFNHDGNLDVAAYAGTSPTQMSFFYGNGDGTFQSRVTVPFSFPIGQVYVGNLNGDVYPDLIVIDAAATTLHPLFGSASGTFTSGTAIAFPANSACGQVAFADFNSDGKTDVAVNCGGAQILYGNGNGTFGAPQVVSSGTRVIGLFAGDFNGDGHPDLLEETIPTGSTTVSILLNNGNGAFTSGEQLSGFDAVLTVADSNNDGKIDLVGSAAETQGTAVAFGNGNGTFQTVVTFGINQTRNVLTGDANNDGKTDLIVQQLDSIYVLPGLGGKSFLQPRQLTISPAATYTIVAAGDLNHDGLDDLLVSQRAGKSGTTLLVSAALNNGGGSFTAGAPVITNADVQAIVTTADLNADGKPDVILFGESNSGGYIETALGNSDGTFQAPQAVQVIPGTVSTYTFADFNGDGKLDVSVLFYVVVSGKGYVTAATYFGNGSGGFSGGTYNTLFAGTIGTGTTLVSGDFNGDGNPDLAVVDLTHFAVLYNNGNGTFSGAANQVARFDYTGLGAGKFNSDSLADLVLLSNPNVNSTGIATVLLNAPGSSAATATYSAGLPNYVSVADLNGDGNPEIIVGSNQSRDLTVLNNQGDGTFVNSGAWIGAGLDANLLIGHFLSPGEIDLVSGYSLFSVVQ